MAYFYAYMCDRGHVEISLRRYREDAKKKCDICGGDMFYRCPSCGEVIKVWQTYGQSVFKPKSLKFDPPDECSACGAKFPWASKKGSAD
ncbi:MAG: DUF2321 domain-containing protein [Anaerovoracaceae bacterium]|jgi:hypothetical protein